MSEFEQKQIDLTAKKQETLDKFRKGLIGFLLMIPANFVGISEMYFPKFKAPEYFWYIVIIQLGVGLAYFFRSEIDLFIKFYKNRNEKV